MPRIHQPETDKTGGNDPEEGPSTFGRLANKRKRTDGKGMSTIDDRVHSRLCDGHHSVIANDVVMDSANDSDSDEEYLHESGEGSDEDSDEDSPSESEDTDEDSPPESDEDSLPESDEDFDEDSLLESNDGSDEDSFDSEDDSEEEIPLSVGMHRREDGVNGFTSSRSRPSLLMHPVALTRQRYQQQINQQMLAASQQMVTRNQQMVARSQQMMARSPQILTRSQLQQRQQQQQVIVYINLGHNATPRGLSESEINRLPARQYTDPNSVPSHSSATEVPHKRTKLNKACVVCWEDYKLGDALRTLPCCHEFHVSCVDPWLKGNRTCPVCRFAVDFDVPTTAIGNK